MHGVAVLPQAVRSLLLLLCMVGAVHFIFRT
jgi:hypothetical protein